MKTSWFIGKEHALNFDNYKNKKKNHKAPTKVYSKEEIKSLAVAMGVAVSDKAGRSGIKATDLPDSLKRFIK